MPDCAPATKDRKCGQPCTIHVGSISRAWYKHCGTGNVGTGTTYQEARDSANQQAENRKKLGITPVGSGKVNLGPQFQGTGKATIKEFIKKEEKQGGGSGVAKNPNAGDVSNLILGSPEDWGKAIDSQMNCFGIPIPCPLLAIGVGAVIVLIVALR